MAELNIFRYIPKESIIHKMDPRLKIICMILYTVAIGIAIRIYDLILFNVILLIALIYSKLPFKKMCVEIKYFLFLIGIVVIVHSFSILGTPIISLSTYGPTWEGFNSGLLFGWKLILIIFICTILTETTTLSLLKNTVEWFLRPIPFIREARVATMFSLTFALIPLILDQTTEMQDAQKSRCIHGRKNPVMRVIFLVVPLLFHTFIRADEIASAMESRCYSDIHTKPVFKTKAIDWLLLIFSGLVCSGIFLKRFI